MCSFLCPYSKGEYHGAYHSSAFVKKVWFFWRLALLSWSRMKCSVSGTPYPLVCPVYRTACVAGSTCSYLNWWYTEIQIALGICYLLKGTDWKTANVKKWCTLLDVYLSFGFVSMLKWKTNFPILVLQCYSIYNARVTRTEFWKVKTSILIPVVNYCYCNSQLIYWGVGQQTGETFVTSVVCCEQLVHFCCLDNVVALIRMYAHPVRQKHRYCIVLAREPQQCNIFWTLLSNAVYLLSGSARKWSLSGSYLGSSVKNTLQKTKTN